MAHPIDIGMGNVCHNFFMSSVFNDCSFAKEKFRNTLQFSDYEGVSLYLIIAFHCFANNIFV